MQFDSLSYIVFFVFVLAGYNLVGSWSKRKNLLLAGSYLFYSAWNPFFLPLLLFSTTLDYGLARWMDNREGHARKMGMIVIVAVNLLVLFYFKYILFFLETASAFLGAVGIHVSQPEFSIVLPLGISFYTFHSLSYCIDVYRKKFKPTKNWRDYALYVSFFPQLVAGPITRWTFMRDQIEIPRKVSVNNFFLGLCLLIFGLFEKIVLADSVFAPVANEIFTVNAPSSAQAWAATLSFSGQIFCDFAGYSTCAIGSALMLGFRLPVNFRNPYAAIGFSDFWQRWHISLSTWLRDYLYIPLGGNRGGSWRTYRNLCLTMLIGGLWHGAGWTFVIWGALHGVYLVIERLLKGIPLGACFFQSVVIRGAGWLFTLLGVCYAWVWFRADSFGQAYDFTWRLLDLQGVVQQISQLDWMQLVAILSFAVLVLVHVLFRSARLEDFFVRMHPVILCFFLSVLIACTILSPGDGNAFIYFQF